MKGKASDICPKCKHCEGLDRFRTMYSCKHYNKYPDSAIGIDSEIDCCNFEEVNMNKIEGKVAEVCPKCKNCKDITHNYDGITAKITEVECEDSYDGMVKTLQADGDIHCERFDPKPPCEKCERFDGTYCHSPNGIYATGNCPSYEEKKEVHKTKTAREIELEAKIMALLSEKSRMEETIAEHNKTISDYENILIDIINAVYDQPDYFEHNIHAYKLLPGRAKHLKYSFELMCDKYDPLMVEKNNLEKEKTAHLKGIERLKKSQEKLQNQVKNLQTTNEESYKREEKLEDKCRKLERRLLDENKRFSRLDSEFLIPLVHTLYPGVKVCKPYSEVLKDIQLLKLANYNLKDDNKGLAEKNKTLDERNTNQFVMIGEKDKEIENLKEKNEIITKMVERRDRWVDGLQRDVYALQNEILNIRDIAQKAYDDTNRD